MFNSWMLSHDACLLLVDRLRELRPKRALEVGSGFSTGIIALYAEELISLEHDKKFAPPWPCVKICNIKDGWFEAELFSEINFVLIDSPSRNPGRSATLPNIWPHLAKDFEVWLDDFNRDHEKSIVEEWKKEFPISVQRIDTERGLAIITPS